MKHWLMAASLICFGSTGALAQSVSTGTISGTTVYGPPTSNYVRPINLSSIQQGLATLYPFKGGTTVAETDIAMFTHSPKDGCLIPAKWQGKVPCEDWAPLAIGFGGSLSGQATVVFDSTLNVAPQISALVFSHVDSSSPQILQQVKAAFDGSSAVKIRVGLGLAGTPVSAGAVEPFNKMFPGRGVGGILENGSRVVVGAAWGW